MTIALGISFHFFTISVSLFQTASALIAATLLYSRQKYEEGNLKKKCSLIKIKKKQRIIPMSRVCAFSPKKLRRDLPAKMGNPECGSDSLSHVLYLRSHSRAWGSTERRGWGERHSAVSSGRRVHNTDGPMISEILHDTRRAGDPARLHMHKHMHACASARIHAHNPRCVVPPSPRGGNFIPTGYRTPEIFLSLDEAEVSWRRWTYLSHYHAIIFTSISVQSSYNWGNIEGIFRYLKVCFI